MKLFEVSVVVDDSWLNWLHARDTFLGINHRKWDPERGLELARPLMQDNEEARWLCGRFEHDKRQRGKEWRDVFLEADDARSLGYAGLVGVPVLRLAKRAAEMGFPLAQAYVASVTFHPFPHKVFWAERAARQCDGWGMAELADCYHHDIAISDFKKLRWLVRTSAMLGFCASQLRYAESFSQSSFARYDWLAKCARYGVGLNMLLDETVEHVKAVGRPRNSPVVFRIGRFFQSVLVGRHLEVGKEGVPLLQGDRFDAVVSAIDYFVKCSEQTRMAVQTWVVIARRMGWYKDVIGMVARRIWEGRKE